MSQPVVYRGVDIFLAMFRFKLSSKKHDDK